MLRWRCLHPLNRSAESTHQHGVFERMAEKRGGAPVAREIGAPIEDEVGAGRVGGDPLRDLDVDEPPARRKFDQRQQRIGGENRHQHDGKRAGDTLLKAIKE
jgi:hypothetical protein